MAKKRRVTPSVQRPSNEEVDAWLNAGSKITPLAPPAEPDVPLPSIRPAPAPIEVAEPELEMQAEPVTLVPKEVVESEAPPVVASEKTAKKAPKKKKATESEVAEDLRHTSVRMPKDLHKRIRRKSIDDERSMNDLIVEVLKKAFRP